MKKISIPVENMIDHLISKLKDTDCMDSICTYTECILGLESCCVEYKEGKLEIELPKEELDLYFPNELKNKLNITEIEQEILI